MLTNYVHMFASSITELIVSSAYHRHLSRDTHHEHLNSDSTLNHMMCVILKMCSSTPPASRNMEQLVA